jgi:hypothetical protein
MMFESFLGKFKFLAKSPMTLFVYGILSKWFITIFVTALVVVYWVFKGLSDAGILQAAEQVVFDAFTQTKSVAQYCIPKIAHFGNFWDCLQDPPAYTPSAEEATLHEGMKKIIDPMNSNHQKDPYSSE